MVTITRHVFINIFQTEHLIHCVAVKFSVGYEKNMSFLVIAKSPKVWKKVEKIGRAPLISPVIQFDPHPKFTLLSY